MEIKNTGYDPKVIQEYREKIQASGRSYIADEEDDNSDEYVHFYFIGKHENREVIYDSVIYTLRLQHESEMFEIAEKRASEHFPDYQKIAYKNDEDASEETMDPKEEEIGLYIAEVMMELEEEEAVKVQENVDMDVFADFGISLDVGLHLEKIVPETIERFIKNFNEDTLSLDQTFYSFQTEDEEM